VAMLANSPFVFVASPSLHVQTFQDFVRQSEALAGEVRLTAAAATTAVSPSLLVLISFIFISF